jgi:hypothetical protein
MSNALSVTLIASCLLAGTLLTACKNDEDQRLRSTAEALSRSADECLYDVRDRAATFENSRPCSLMSSLASTYVSAGGFRDSTPADIELIAQKARATAWMARATALAGNRPLKIW